MENKTLSKKTVYSLEDKHKAALAFLMFGTVAGASRECGIPRRTIQDWSKSDWWDEALETCRVEVEHKLRAGWNQIIDQSHREVLERLRNGDEILDKKGNKTRVKVKAKDAAIIGAMAYDKLRVSNNLPTHIREDSTSLSAMAEEFARIAREREKTVVSNQ